MTVSNNTLSKPANFMPPMQTSLLCIVRCKEGVAWWRHENCRISAWVRSHRRLILPEFSAEWADF